MLKSTSPRYSSDVVVIDLEASSSDPEHNDVRQSNIIEIAAVRLDRRTLAARDTFCELVRPHSIPILPFIAALTGITPEMVAGCDTFDRVASRFIDWYGPRNKSILAAWGVYYDLPLLRHECQAFGIDFRRHFVGGALDVRSVALAWLAEHRHDTTGVSIERTLKKMGVEGLELGAHRALDDARGAAAALQVCHLGQASV